ncbi:MAG: FUSC family membrane protein [Bacteroidota bacterium]
MQVSLTPMDYTKEYRSFISSHYLTEGIRMTVGILLPALLFGYLDHLATGITIALGAMVVSITDNPGPIHHRRNGVIICAFMVFAVALITGFTLLVPWLFFILLPVFCFFFSMIGVYGTRATSIGIAALLIMVLQTQHQLAGWNIVFNALYILSGSAWYILLSQALHRVRPYKLMQQALGEYVLAAGEYLRVKAGFYAMDVEYEKSYQQLLTTQIAVQEKQNLVAELLFKTRSVVKESTHTARVLMMVFLDVADLFERAMTSHQDYEKLHRYFNETGILDEYRELINILANDLDEIGIALNSGRASKYNKAIDKELLEEREHLQQLRLAVLKPANLDGFISLRHILDSIDDIAARIRTLHHYTSYDVQLKRKKLQAPDPEDFISHEEFDPKLLFENLSFRSNIFRHSLRISLAALSAYIIALFLPFGHGYWILLTVIVILKPAYSLTKKRNFERLAGTIAGALIGALFLYLVKNDTAIIITLTVFMIGAYSFMRKQYLVSVILMTAYLMMMFHLLEPQDFKIILTDRIIDTAIGSVLALIFSYLLAPVWEHEHIHELMAPVLKDGLEYYNQTAAVFTGSPIDKATTRVARKNNLVSLANLSDAFNRMLNEPKSKQKNMEQVHQFVVSNHMLVSHIATLAYYTDNLQPELIMDDYKPVIQASTACLTQALELTDAERPPEQLIEKENAQIRLLDEKINLLMQQRQEEIKLGQMETGTKKKLSDFKSITDQFYFIYKIVTDVQKICVRMRG